MGAEGRRWVGLYKDNTSNSTDTHTYAEISIGKAKEIKM